jgi:hypothetical protein
MRALIFLILPACAFDLTEAPRPFAADGGVERQTDNTPPDTGAGDVPGEVGVDAGGEARGEVGSGDAGGETGEVKPKDAEVEVGVEVGVEAAVEVGVEAAVETAVEVPVEMPVTLKTNGQPCATGAQCGSGFCVDGVCCGTACDSPIEKACYSCNLAGKEGTCSAKCGACYSSCGYWSCMAC